MDRFVAIPTLSSCIRRYPPASPPVRHVLREGEGEEWLLKNTKCMSNGTNLRGECLEMTVDAASPKLDPTKPLVWLSGCAGFIGFHVCSRLLNEGYSVVGLDNMNTYL